jgi:hypothetical protein
MSEIMPGDRVLVFDPRLFKDDVSTPPSMTMKPATVVCRYGYKHVAANEDESDRVYPDLVDVEFDHRGLSKGHFIYGVKPL